MGDIVRQDRAQALETARPMREYAQLIPEPGFGPLDFELFPYQRDWYSDEVADAEEVVFMKSTQVGQSAWAWRWAVRRVDQFGETCIYIFPTDTHVKTFGDERIEPAIEESAYLKAKMTRHSVRHKTLKKIGRGFLHLRGSNSKAGAQSVAAQDLVFDEYDLLDATNLPQIERRITGARQVGKRPRVRRLGTPTIEGEGIAAAYESSDKRVWMVACSGCGLEQEITWEENLRWRNTPDGEVMRAGHDEYEDATHVEEVWRQCKGCETHLDVATGRWVAQHPERRVIGFHATRLIVPNTDLAQIVKASRKTKPQDVETFENNDLGRAYSSAQSALSMMALLAACELGGAMVDGYSGQYPTTMGVDVAGERDLNVRIDEQLPAENPMLPNPRRALWIGRVKTFEQLVQMIQAFRCHVVVIDDNPERRMAKAVRATFAPGRVILCGYNADSDSATIDVKTGPAGSPLEGVPLNVRVNRTEAIDAMMDSIRQLRNLPLRDPPPGWFDQMRALRRKTELDKKGRVKRLYVTVGNAGDDYAHTDVYALVATELWRMRGGANMLRPRDHSVPDEEIGFKRMNLRRDDGSPGYHAGFNEGRLD